MSRRNVAAMSVAALLGGCGITLSTIAPRVLAQSAPAASVPTFEPDETWAPTLPDGQVFGGIAAIAIDRHDHAWVLHRARQVPAEQKAKAAPPVVELDANGRFVRAWGGPGTGYEWPDSEHGIHVDDQDMVWIAGNAGPGTLRVAEPWRDDDMLLKFSADGKFVGQFGRRDQSRGNLDENNLRGPAGLTVHRPTNEVFVADGYSNRRLVVLDADKLTFKRMWGAFGKTPVDVFPLPPVDPAFKKGPVPPEGPAPGPDAYWIVHSVAVSSDGRVYVGDREYGRVQVFDLAGKYLDQFMVSPAEGWAASMALSPDPRQQWLYVADIDGRVMVVDRESLKLLTEFKTGLSGHHITIDSKGNLYFSQLGRGAKRLRFTGTRAAIR